MYKIDPLIIFTSRIGNTEEIGFIYYNTSDTVTRYRCFACGVSNQGSFAKKAQDFKTNKTGIILKIFSLYVAQMGDICPDGTNVSHLCHIYLSLQTQPGSDVSWCDVCELTLTLLVSFMEK